MPINLNSHDSQTSGSVARSSALNSESRTSSVGGLTLYTARIVEVFPTSNVALLNSGDGIYGLFVGNAIAAFLGISAHYIPEVGTMVLVLKNLDVEKGYDYILGEIPNTGMAADWMSFTKFIGVDSKAYTGLKQQKRYESQEGMPTGDNGTLFMDVTEGEFVRSSGYGPLLGLLNSLAVLKGSDLAKIECFVMDDLVRILSEQFEHFSAFGEYKIVNNNGKLDVIWKGTSEEHEAWGLKQESEAKPIEVGQSNQLNMDVDSMKEEDLFYGDGRWRFNSYIGKLGNFVHIFVTDPVKVLQKTSDEGGKPPSARADVHINKDGSLVVRSVSDIVFEKVCRIPVPIAKVRPEELDYTKIELNAYQTWKPFSGPETLFETSYALQDYARWLSNYYSMATFFALKGQYTVASEQGTEEPSWFCGDQKMQGPMASEAESSKVYLEKYATVRIFKDGSIVLADGYHSAVHLTNGNVEISAAMDITLTAGNNINLVAKNISQLAYDEVDISAVTRGILLKSKTWLEQYCADGPVIIQSNMDPESPPQTNGDDGSDDEARTRWEEAQGSGIILKTSNRASILHTSQMGSVIVQAFSYLNSSRYVLFAPALSFTIKDVLQATPNLMQVTARVSKFNTVFTDGILNSQDKSMVVATTGQKGLTLVYGGGDGKPDFSFEETLEDASTTDQMRQYYDGNLAEKSTFKYIPSNDSKVPQYEEIYQPLGQQLLSAAVENGGDDGIASKYKREQLTSQDYGTPVINYPMYPGNPSKSNYVTYKAKLDPLGKPCSQSDISPGSAHGSFSQGMYYFMKYKENVIYGTR